jgi:hypothetical protein
MFLKRGVSSQRHANAPKSIDDRGKCVVRRVSCFTRSRKRCKPIQVRRNFVLYFFLAKSRELHAVDRSSRTAAKMGAVNNIAVRCIPIAAPTDDVRQIPTTSKRDFDAIALLSTNPL